MICRTPYLASSRSAPSSPNHVSVSGMMTPESLSRECSPTPQEIILAAPGSSPDQGTTISIPDLKATGPGATQTLKLTTGGLQLTSLAPGQPLQLTAGGQIVSSNGAPLQPAQILTNGGGALNMVTNGNSGALNMTAMTPGGKLIVASPVSTPRLIVPAAQLTMVPPTAPVVTSDKSPGQQARIVSLGGVTLTSSASPSTAVSSIIQRAKQSQVTVSSTPVLLQPAAGQHADSGLKRGYQPITPGTQIILSEGVAPGPVNGAAGGAVLPRVSINPIVSLPLHPVPQSQVTVSMTR